jgi:hypothetical protein
VAFLSATDGKTVMILPAGCMTDSSIVSAKARFSWMWTLSSRAWTSPSFVHVGAVWQAAARLLSRERVQTILAHWTTGTPWFLPKFVSRRYGIRVISKPGGAFGDRDEYGLSGSGRTLAHWSVNHDEQGTQSTGYTRDD